MNTLAGARLVSEASDHVQVGVEDFLPCDRADVPADSEPLRTELCEMFPREIEHDPHLGPLIRVKIEWGLDVPVRHDHHLRAPGRVDRSEEKEAASRQDRLVEQQLVVETKATLRAAAHSPSTGTSRITSPVLPS